MKNFVIKGNVLYSTSFNEIAEYKDSYLVCVNGVAQGVYCDLPDIYRELPLSDYGNRNIEKDKKEDVMMSEKNADSHLHLESTLVKSRRINLAGCRYGRLQE